MEDDLNNEDNLNLFLNGMQGHIHPKYAFNFFLVTASLASPSLT
jgi:hypothetical protein